MGRFSVAAAQEQQPVIRKGDQRASLLMIPVLLLAMFLLLRVAWGTSMHPDETLVYQFTRFDILSTVNYLATQDVHPPLWFSFFWVWRTLVGDSEFAGRMQALLFSLVALAMTYRIGRDWFGRPRAGLFATAILAVSAYFLDYALEIRPYALVILLSTFSMWLFARWLQRGTWRLALAYGVVTAIMFYVHYFLAFLVIAQVIYFLLRRPSRRLIGQALGAGALAFVLWLPWLPSFLNQVSLLRQLAQESGEAYGLGVGTPATTQTTSLDTFVKLAQLATNGQLLLYGLVLVLGVVLLRRKAQFWLALLWALGVPLIALALNTAAAVYSQRYVSYLAVGLALALGAALASLGRRLVRDLVLAALVLLSLWFAPGWLPVRVPYRELYAQVSALGQAGDVVLNTPATTYEQFTQWQQQRYLSPDLQTEVTTDAAEAQGARRVWFMTPDWFNPAVQVQFEQLEPTHPVQAVVGQCDRAWCYIAQLMEAPPLAAPQRFGANMDFWGIDVDEVTPTAIATRLWWRVERAPTLDYSISLRLLDSAGAVAAQKDGPIVHYGTNTVQTSQLQPGKIYIDWRTLDLPAGLAAGQYTLQLVVYQSWDGARLPLAGGSDALSVYSLTIS